MIARVLSGGAAAALLVLVGLTGTGGPARGDTDSPLCGGFICHRVAVGPSPVTAPTGPYPVGRVDTPLGDDERAIMVSAWYPAAEIGSPTSYVPASGPDADIRIASTAATWLHSPVSAAAAIGAAAPAAESVPADTTLGRLPVLLMSPGLGSPRWILSGLAADLASRGWVVVVADHTGESPAVEFPSGRVVLGDPPTMTDDYMRERLIARVADTRTVLDHLTELPIVGDLVDLGAVAMLGHSYGGYTAVSVAAADPRIRAAVVLDGSAGWHDGAAVERRGLDRPVMLVGYGAMVDASWIAFGHHTPGPFTVAMVRGGEHYTPTDLPELGGPPELCGTLPPDRAAAVTRGLVADFLTRSVLGRPASGEVWPEVEWPTSMD
ncbi:alpha/beta hydrolase family protein [Nocardia sp. alder85J]|uniref:alpha/beta hydrolase family protein n=1 Tax=Nocardia sp. alder85J TaxID=2862949 RepID=UPI001CD4D10B|nr:CocE/NonD family hydrolase [Nocardia sp. alder85J]MCX4097137.1 hypothetical protein [Nocardia sp. alder85J]